MKLKNNVWRFPRRTKIADFRKNADNWKHWLINAKWGKSDLSVKLGDYGSNRENARYNYYSQRLCRLLPGASSRGLNIANLDAFQILMPKSGAAAVR